MAARGFQVSGIGELLEAKLNPAGKMEDGRDYKESHSVTLGYMGGKFRFKCAPEQYHALKEAEGKSFKFVASLVEGYQGKADVRLLQIQEAPPK